MNRTKLVAVAVIALLVLGGSLVHMMAGQAALADVPTPPAAGRTTAPTGDAYDARRQALTAARRACRIDELDRYIAAQRGDTAAQPEDSEAHRLLAEALLERVLMRNLLRGMVVGEALYDELPAETDRDIQEGLEAIAKARALGDTSGDTYRIEASLLCNRITGWLAAVNLNSTIGEALQRAVELDANNPRLHVALGCRLLLAPKFFGHDAEKALEHFEYAAQSLPEDERPRVFAAMATWLLDKREHAREWLRRALVVNPRNAFAKAVAERMERGEEDPFARDVIVADLPAASASDRGDDVPEPVRRRE